MKYIAATAALLLAPVSVQAQTTTYGGTMVATDNGSSAFSFGTGASSGSYRVTWSFNAPDAMAELLVRESFQAITYSPSGGVSSDWDYLDTSDGFAGPSGSMIVDVRPPSRIDYPDGSYVITTFLASSLFFTFGGTPVSVLAPNQTVAWTASVTKLVAVPEPSAWALVISGFAIVGAALRRRKLQPAAIRVHAR